ncbi:hypothetical protein G6F68_010639 [Rhizopus microsporus]|nr:hypothetical protein G6F68_010639 [Rhizopus microsporus]
MVAAQGGHLPMVELLLDSGADVARVDFEGRTALALAEARGHAAVVQRLQAAGAQRPPALEETPPLAWPEPAADGEPAAVVRGYMLACHAWETRGYRDAKAGGNLLGSAAFQQERADILAAWCTDRKRVYSTGMAVGNPPVHVPEDLLAATSQPTASKADVLVRDHAQKSLADRRAEEAPVPHRGVVVGDSLSAETAAAGNLPAAPPREAPMAHPISVSLIGVPTDVGAGHRGARLGPEALRVAGLPEALEARGVDVRDLGNLDGPRNPWTAPVEGYRHLDEVVAWNHALMEASYAELQAGRMPIMLGGDHCLGIGSITAVARWCREQGKTLRVLWLDAHSDFNTSDVTPSGNIHGMPVACLCGLGPDALTRLGGTKAPDQDPQGRCL